MRVPDIRPLFSVGPESRGHEQSAKLAFPDTVPANRLGLPLYLYRRGVSHVLHEALHARPGCEEEVLPLQRVRRPPHRLLAVETLAAFAGGGRRCGRRTLRMRMVKNNENSHNIQPNVVHTGTKAERGKADKNPIFRGKHCAGRIGGRGHCLERGDRSLSGGKAGWGGGIFVAFTGPGMNKLRARPPRLGRTLSFSGQV